MEDQRDNVFDFQGFRRRISEQPKPIIPPPLPTGDRVSTFENMDRSQIEDMLAASEARSETKLVATLGEIKAELAGVRGDIRELKATTASKATVIITAISLFLGLAAVVFAALTYGNNQFGQGLSASDVASKAAERALQQDETARARQALTSPTSASVYAAKSAPTSR